MSPEIDKSDKTNPKNSKIWSSAIGYTNVVIVDRAIDLAKQYDSNLFYGVESVIVNPSGASNIRGYVTNGTDSMKGDQSRIIYIIVAPNKHEAETKLKNEGLDDAERNSIIDRATTIVVAQTMVHEGGHIKDELKSGEAPAENEEKKFDSFFQTEWNKLIKPLKDKKKEGALSYDQMIRLAGWFEKVTR